jgi:hypothetical protein
MRLLSRCRVDTTVRAFSFHLVEREDTNHSHQIRKAVFNFKFNEVVKEKLPDPTISESLAVERKQSSRFSIVLQNNQIQYSCLICIVC